jgi:hypothetical protein
MHSNRMRLDLDASVGVPVGMAHQQTALMVFEMRTT